MKQDKYTAVIIDDEQAAIDVLQRLLTNFNEINVIDTADNGIDGEYLISQHQPDIAFVDIDMPGKNGVEVLRDMHNVHNNTKIIFITAYESYAVESIKYHPFGYLLKPISSNQLKEAICHVISDQESNKKNSHNKKLKVASKQEVLFIDYNKILYFKADGNYTQLVLIDSEIINITQQLGKVEEDLPKQTFFRINRSEIVNIKHVKSLRRRESQIFLSSKKALIMLKVSRSKIHEVEELVSKTVS